MKISYLGPEASFSHICCTEIVARELFSGAELLACADFGEVFGALEDGRADSALLPLENSLGGTLSEPLELLWRRRDFSVHLEYVLKIQHSLLGFGLREEVREIRAHPQALSQCREYLNRNYPNAVRTETSSNSQGVKSLLASRDRSTVAIAARQAGELYHVPLLQENIQDSNDNYTRFWLIGRVGDVSPRVSGAEFLQYMQSFAFRIPRDEPGGLLRALTPLAEHNINMTRIVSIPTRGNLCEYTFFIDCINDSGHDLSSIPCSEYRLIGDYPVLPIGDPRFVVHNPS